MNYHIKDGCRPFTIGLSGKAATSSLEFNSIPVLFPGQWSYSNYKQRYNFNFCYSLIWYEFTINEIQCNSTFILWNGYSCTWLSFYSNRTLSLFHPSISNFTHLFHYYWMRVLPNWWMWIHLGIISPTNNKTPKKSKTLNSCFSSVPRKSRLNIS